MECLKGMTRRPKSIHVKLECGPMPNVLAALPNIGGPSAQRRSLADAHYSSAVQ